MKRININAVEIAEQSKDNSSNINFFSQIRAEIVQI